VSPEANYPLGCWYIAGTSDEVGRQLIRRRLLDRDVVLFRQASGAVVALEDRCAHRSFPLSHGRLEGDLLVCGYHGFTYDAAGSCVRVPSQDHVPYGARVDAFEVREQPPFVWIWLGAPGESGRRAPYHPSWLHEEGWTSWGGQGHIDANHLLIHEDLLDLTAAPFVYPEIAPPVLLSPPPLEVEVTETSVSYHRTFPSGRLSGWQAGATGLAEDQDYEQSESGTFVSPALWVGGWEVGAPTEHGDVHRLAWAYALTPAGPTSTHVIWIAARNWATAQPAITEYMAPRFEEFFRRRKSVLEAVQANLDGSDRRGVSVSADAAGLRAREIVATMLAQERGRAVLRPR
jgi:phenylpropionate dioxygenase-like ring-hydroxylating dioxygenase large terminal subunit